MLVVLRPCGPPQSIGFGTASAGDLRGINQRVLSPGGRWRRRGFWHTTGTPGCQKQRQNCGFRLIGSHSTSKAQAFDHDDTGARNPFQLRGTWNCFRYSSKNIKREVGYEESCLSASVDDRSNERSRCWNVCCERCLGSRRFLCWRLSA